MPVVGGGDIAALIYYQLEYDVVFRFQSFLKKKKKNHENHEPGCSEMREDWLEHAPVTMVTMRMYGMTSGSGPEVIGCQGSGNEVRMFSFFFFFDKTDTDLKGMSTLTLSWI